MMVYYLQDKEKVVAQSSEKGVYSPLYLEEMVSRLGVPARELPMEMVCNTPFAADDVVLIGAETLSPDLAEFLSSAAKGGTLIIGFAVQGGDSLFGCTLEETITQSDLYETVGSFSAPKHILPSKEESVSLPVMADVLVTTGGRVEATIRVKDREVPGLIMGRNTCYVPFDLPYALLKIVQGKPVPEGASSYFPVGRVPDGRSLPYDFDSTNPAADLYYLMLETMLAERKVPMVHVLPPMKDGTPADLLFFYGGDDDNTSAQLDEKASGIMAEKHLPYHINLMPGSDRGDYTLDKEGYGKITARGHELALHYNMTGVPFTKESFEQQMGTYMETYGILPISNVAHCLVNVGYAEYARWQASLGVKGDGGRMGTLNLADINAFNIYDFGFGTAFPHFVYDDADHQSKRLNFCGIPMTYYEPRLGGPYGEDGETLRKCAENAGYYGQTINLFSHPHYVAFWNGYDSNMTLNALDYILAYCDSKGWQVYNAGTDELCLWWHERDACRLTAKQGALEVTLSGDSPMVVKLPATASAVLLDGVSVPTVAKTIGGITYNLVTVQGTGTHILTY